MSEKIEVDKEVLLRLWSLFVTAVDCGGCPFAETCEGASGNTCDEVMLKEVTR